MRVREKFVPVIPKKPFLKRRTYSVPRSYKMAYKRAGITDADEQMMCFHVTQFGGFRMKKVPKDMTFEQDFLEKWFTHEFDGRYNHYKANPNFLDKFGRLRLKPLEKQWFIDEFNEKDMLEFGFSEEEIKKARIFLIHLNDFYESLRLGFDIPHSGITAKDRVQLPRLHGIPFLVKKPKAGGRFFHPETSYQRISSSLRRRMTINGEPTSEFDLSAAVIQFLEIALQLKCTLSLEDSVLAHEDPYQYFLSTLNSEGVLSQNGNCRINREDLKTVLYTAIYSKGKRERANVNRKLRLMGLGYRYSDLVHFFPEFFEALGALRDTTGKPLHIVIYREESKFAQEVLQRGCLDQKIPILPVHDSFITIQEHVGTLQGIIDRAADDLYSRGLKYRRKY